VKEDRWMCVSGQPATNDKGESWVELADGYGGTSTYGLKEVEGPFPDNYTLAKVMKKYKLQQVDLWPPVTSAVGRDVQPRVNADEIPDNPRDFGRAALPAQVIHTDPALQDWVIYSVEDRWLHLGTRVEFDKPVMEKEVLWGGHERRTGLQETAGAAGREQATVLLATTGTRRAGSLPVGDISVV